MHTSIMTPTQELRFVRRAAGSNIDGSPRVAMILQQKWVSMTSLNHTFEWRDVPVEDEV
jgi:hypothetical protein